MRPHNLQPAGADLERAHPCDSELITTKDVGSGIPPRNHNLGKPVTIAHVQISSWEHAVPTIMRTSEENCPFQNFCSHNNIALYIRLADWFSNENGEKEYTQE